jgi:uncharacterized HAD superfamily protein
MVITILVEEVEVVGLNLAEMVEQAAAVAVLQVDLHLADLEDQEVVVVLEELLEEQEQVILLVDQQHMAEMVEQILAVAVEVAHNLLIVGVHTHMVETVDQE